MFYFYVLFSKSSNTYYKGFTENLKKRVENHFAGRDEKLSIYSEFISESKDSFFDLKKFVLLFLIY